MIFLRKISTWRNVCITAIIYFAYAFLVMARFGKTETLNLGPLDLMFSYSPDTAYKHLESFGEKGRAAYMTFSLYADTLYPVIYALFLTLLILKLVKSVWPQRTRIHLIALLPIFASIFDLLENMGIRSMLRHYPGRQDSIASITSTFTTLKWSSLSVSFLMILILLGLLAVSKTRR